MMKVAQRLCPCAASGPFTRDVHSDMWVHTKCGLPRWEYYFNRRAAQRPGVPVKYAKGNQQATTARGTATAQ